MLDKIKSALKDAKIFGYIIPCSDEFQNECVADHANRLKCVSSFAGSNGLLVVLPQIALFFTDGRYLEQASKQLDAKNYEVHDIAMIRTFPWNNYFSAEAELGYDPLLFTKRQLLAFGDCKLKEIHPNLVDANWDARPPKLATDIFIYPQEYSGEASDIRITKLQNRLDGNQLYLITDTASVCYILNLRNKGEGTVGMFDCYMTVSSQGTILFTDVALPDDIKKYLAQLNVNLKPTGSIFDELKQNKEIIVDEETCSIAFLNTILSKIAGTPYKLDKAIKNQTEIEGAKKAHVLDAITLCELLAWLDKKDFSAKDISECNISSKLIELRQKHPLYIKESFPAICGYRENSSIIHYRAAEPSAKKIDGQGILLIDTGGHYYGGTTDVTRTIFLGEPSDEEKKFYTLVLKGHIALAKAKFKKGCSGANLDVLSRQFLWDNAADYPHGTGHGVGNFLNVHEGPQAIGLYANEKLVPGMIISNEPGYYKPGKFGIRIESLVCVEPSKDSDFLQFKTMTLVPFAAKLINRSMLNHDEMLWIKNYYHKVHEQIRPLLGKQAQEWLDHETYSFCGE